MTNFPWQAATAAWLLATVSLPTARIVDTNRSAARIAALHGAVGLRLEGQQTPLRVGDTVRAGATLVTAQGQTAALVLGGGARIDLDQRSRIEFDAADRSAVRGTSFALLAGTVRLHDDAQPAAPAAPVYIVRTPLARVVFRRESGYITASRDEVVVACVRCESFSTRGCADNDFVVSDVTQCVPLSSGEVVFVTREHGIETPATRGLTARAAESILPTGYATDRL